MSSQLGVCHWEFCFCHFYISSLDHNALGKIALDSSTQFNALRGHIEIITPVILKDLAVLEAIAL